MNPNQLEGTFVGTASHPKVTASGIKYVVQHMRSQADGHSYGGIMMPVGLSHDQIQEVNQDAQAQPEYSQWSMAPIQGAAKTNPQDTYYPGGLVSANQFNETYRRGNQNWDNSGNPLSSAKNKVAMKMA